MMKSIASTMIVLTLLLGVFVVSSCASAPPITGAAKQEFQDVSARQAYELMEQNKDNANFTVLDVRTPEEFADGHLVNAVNLDYNSGSFSSRVGQLDREKTYLVYCRSGNRSRGAIDVMKQSGFKKVYHLAKGILEWQGEGLPISK